MTLFHPLEVGFCGFSGSGKTTLIERLIAELSKEFKVGYAKHDSHSFEMDHPGKDSYRAWHAGANQVSINDPEHRAHLLRGESDPLENDLLFLQNDILLIEGYKNGPQPKILVLDEAQSILNGDLIKTLQPIIGCVGAPEAKDFWNEQTRKLLRDTPYFQRDNIRDLTVHLKKFWTETLNQKPFFGLVLSGGLSRRMQQDKALLKYHETNQVEHTFNLISPYCQKTFVSCRKGQWQNQFDHLPQIHDQFLNMGPLGGILSAMVLHPESSWVVVACDLPFLDRPTLEQLLSQRNPYKMATVFDNPENSLPEPLCAIYESKFRSRLFGFLSADIRCPRKIMLRSRVERLRIQSGLTLSNVNQPEEYEMALLQLNPDQSPFL